jgi:phytoene synthase
MADSAPPPESGPVSPLSAQGAPDASGERLDALVRRVDEDRWLASRFADPAGRNRLIALAAFYYEVARAPEAVSEPMIGEIRLQWWRDAITAIYADGALPAHPVVEAAAAAIVEAQLPREPFDAMIDARSKDLEAAPFTAWADLEAYVDATAGGLARLSAIAAAPGHLFDESQNAALRSAGRAWGFTGLVRAMPFWRDRGRTFFPQKLMEHVGITEGEAINGKLGHTHWAAACAVLDRGEGAFKDARHSLRQLPASAFPAVSYVALAPLYLKALRRDGLTPGPEAKPLGILTKRLKLVAATATGGI